MSKELAPCGTPAARKRHKKRGETCQACAPKPRVLAACGTKPAKARHKARGEECQECAPKGRAIHGCGTWQARRRHRRNNETCTTCDTAKTTAHEEKLAPCGTSAARQRHWKRGETCEACKPKPQKLAPCGTKAALERHNRRGETCQTCTDARTARIKSLEAPCGTNGARARHTKRGETCTTCNNTPRTLQLKPCGTVAAAKRHRVNGEPVCDPCNQAENEYSAKLRRKKGIPERLPLEDLLDEIRFLVNAGEGTHRILQATGYLGRENSLRARLQKAGEYHLANMVLNPWELAA